METGRKRPSNEGRYRSDKADRVQQCLARLTSLTSNEAKEHTRTLHNNAQAIKHKNTSQQCLTRTRSREILDQKLARA
jgi:hypothetical protein